MTTQGQPANDTIRRLRRRTSDRVIGGVAGGLGDYLNVDPLLIRIGFVGLMVFGGAGLVLYVIAWLLIPAEGQDESGVERVLRRIGLRFFGWVALAFIVVILFSMSDDGYGPSLGYFPTWFWALVVLVIGVLVLRREGPPQVSEPSSASSNASSVTSAPPMVAMPREPPKPRGPLGWYSLAAVLIVVGVLASIQNIAELDVDLGQYFGVALLILGIGLVIGAWWGRARLLIVLGILLLPLGVAASFITAPLEGGFGELTFAPASSQELQGEYRLVGGRLVLDLTQMDATAGQVDVDASVAIGQLTVVVPDEAALDVDVAVGGGAIGFLDTDWIGGTGVTNHYSRAGNGANYLLALEAGVGEIRVVTPELQERWGYGCGWWTSCGRQLVIPEEELTDGPSSR